MFFISMLSTGILIFLYCLFFQKHLVRIEWDIVAKWCAFLVLVMAMRSALWMNNPPSAGPVTFRNVIMVFWEDCFFAIPIYFMKDYLKLSKKMWVPIAIALSMTFASGHLYQGLSAAIVLGTVPYFIIYRFGKEHGFGTTMVCHIIFDFMSVMTLKLITLFYLLRI